MKEISVIVIALLSFLGVNGQVKYSPLDEKNPVAFTGDQIIYKNEKIQLGPHAFFVDGQLSDHEVSKYDYVFNSVNEAVMHLTDGTEGDPMILYLAPWVYWIDDPDDPQVRVPKSGDVPFGLEIECEWLKFYGLADDPQNVVLAANRGQTMGAKGNFTLFNIKGNGLSAENVTFGNYCNIDLEYPLNLRLNRKKRGSAIVQAQLVFSDGDKVVARNTNFISRLNLGPFWGSKRTLFDGCHFESTDDALNGSAVYLNCTFDFFSGKPFYRAIGTGTVFLNCDITSYTRGKQYFTKAGGQVAVVDTRFHSESLSSIGWQDQPAWEARNYQYNVSLNGELISLSLQHTYATVDMEGKLVLDAYRFKYNNKVVYNTYNLLKGDDDWDPMGIKEMVQKAEAQTGKVYSNLPTRLLIVPTRDTIETGKDTLLLQSVVNKFGNDEVKGEKINWSLAPEFDELIDLIDFKDGTCQIIPTNENDETKEIVITASTSSGLKAASVLYVSPLILDAPEFVKKPKILIKEKGVLDITYELDMHFEDQSLITWYRCTDKGGSNAIKVAVSRFNQSKLKYHLSGGDVGYFIMATVSPNHLRCTPGDPVASIFRHRISQKDIYTPKIEYQVDLKSLPTSYQPLVKPGFWTVDGYKPNDTNEYDWSVDNEKDPWYYGVGINGAANDTGLIQAQKGARLRFTPVENDFGDMKISFTACPAKTAGQGFSSAKAQYMDICIKFDTERLNGYALRLIRTTKYHNAIDCILMKYENGIAEPVSRPVSTSCYRTPCYITLEVKGNNLFARMESPADYYRSDNQPEVLTKVTIETPIIPNGYGGIGFQHTGSVGSGATLVKDLKIEWF